MPYEIGDYMVGDDVDALLSGDDDILEIGAIRASQRASATRGAMTRPRGGIPGLMRQQALAQSQAQSQTLVKGRDFARGREYPLGFDSVANVAAAATAIVNSQPQVVFRPDRLVIPAAIAGSFVVNDLRIGKNSQFANATPVPASVFAETAFGVSLKCDTAQISQVISLNVTNISGGALQFRAALIGPAIE